jgi:hypothetical protein
MDHPARGVGLVAATEAWPQTVAWAEGDDGRPVPEVQDVDRDLWTVPRTGALAAPDVEVELDPKAWRPGHDLQLEKAVEIALAALAKNPLPVHPRPAYPNYQKR